jgi:hypothetical protein
MESPGSGAGWEIPLEEILHRSNASVAAGRAIVQSNFMQPLIVERLPPPELLESPLRGEIIDF